MVWQGVVWGGFQEEVGLKLLKFQEGVARQRRHCEAQGTEQGDKNAKSGTRASWGGDSGWCGGHKRC